MKIVILTNDNFFSFTVLRSFFKKRRKDISLVVFSSALIGKKGKLASIKWTLQHTGIRHTLFKLLVYSVFKVMRLVCQLIPYIPNEYSTRLWVRQNGLASINARNINDSKVVERIRSAAPDLIISVSMNQIVKKELLEMPPERCINVHCAPLPRYAGMSPYVWALANKEDHSAATIHYMEEGLDEGDIIAQETEDILKNDSAFCLFYRCCLRAEKLLPVVVDQIESGTVISRPQDLSQKTYFSWPTKECARACRKNGYALAKFSDFGMAISQRGPRLKKQPSQTTIKTLPITQAGKRADIIDSNQPKSVFITYGWCRTAYAVVLSLGKRGVDVHVSDASGLAMSRWSRYCRSFTRVPDFFVEPDAYFEATCKALEKIGPTVLLPSHEDVGIFCRRKDELPDNVRVALPDWQTYRTVEDKLTVLDVARKADCPTPWAVEVESESQLDEFSESAEWPVVIKTRITNSAKGVRIARNGSELRGKFMELVQTYDLAKDRWPILQQYLPGEAAGVCLLYQNGKCVASFGERYLRCKEPDKFGTSTLRESYPNQDLIDRAIRVMDKSHWHGVVHLDFVADEDGVFRLIEINPRLWGALAMSLFACVDFPYMWYLTALGEPVTEHADVEHRPIKCRWIVGDSMALLELLKHRRFSEAAQVFIPGRRCFHDDFVLSDPLPLSFEIADYITKFVKAGCSMNPVTQGMVR